MTIERIHILHLLEYAEHCGLLTSYAIASEKKKLGATIEVDYYMDTYTDLYTRSQDAYFGLHFGTFLNMKALGIIYDISLETSSIEQMAMLWMHYAAISFPIISIKAHKETTQYRITFESTQQSAIHHQILDTILMFAYRELKIITGTSLLALQLPYTIYTEYQNWYDCPISTGMCHTIIFECPAEKISTNKNQRKQIECLLPIFISLYSKVKDDTPSFATNVKSMLLNSYYLEFLSVKEIASLFCVTERTLQRKLKEEHTSYRIIVNELKKELYSYLKKDTTIKRNELSILLGYSSTSAFLHALKAWKSTSYKLWWL